MKKIIVGAAFLLLFLHVAGQRPPEEFNLLVQRTANVGDSLITGVLYVNGEAIGKTYENADSLVTAGEYRGLLRYYSRRGFATGPLGSIGNVGDFLLEIENARSPTRRIKTDVLFHCGFLPSHSKGCILLGPASGPRGARYIADDHALRRLRQKFYGSEFPNSTPNKDILISIVKQY